ncbi:MAG: helix-turn-helix domain-containing protein [Alphaproteobacteria bacterium]|nr:helix-turn-helix domain-containing protein [Alphaproteobacteria bacterium]
MIAASAPERRQELGEFIRAQRERLDPATVGMPGGTRRRTPGLRREEVAQICGLSVTWYTWIEQGREVAASVSALSRLATGLRLGRAERAYLFDLAGKRDPERCDADPSELPNAVLDCLAVIAAPAYLLDSMWNARGWNKAAEELFVGWLDRPGERSLLRFIFLDPAARALILDWDNRAHRVVAEFRAQAGARLHQPVLRALVEELRGASPDFARLWEQHGVLGREGGERSFAHPRRGLLRFRQVTFDLASQPDIRLTMLLPADGT